MSAHWVLLTMAFKPLVALLRRQCNARRLANLFRKEHLQNRVVVLHKIHCMTPGVRRVVIPGMLPNLVVRLVNRHTTRLPRPVVRKEAPHPCDLEPNPLRHGPRASP